MTKAGRSWNIPISSSIKKNGPLSPVASTKIESIFNQTDINLLASEGLCNQIEILVMEITIHQKRTTMPNLLYECGKTFEEAGNNYGAIQMYEEFILNYPTHQLASFVDDALAMAIVAEARASGAGVIPAPQRSGSTSSRSSVVIIQNDSPEHLRIVFSGPDSRIQELAACSSCQTYSLTGPSFCPEKGPIGR